MNKKSDPFSLLTDSRLTSTDCSAESRAAVSMDQVRTAYELMLGRVPENDDVVRQLAASVDSLEGLRLAFERSAEYQKRLANLLQVSQPKNIRHPFHLPKIPVQTQVTPEQLSAMFDRIQRGWAALGQSEPYWSVITQPQYQHNAFSDNEMQFYQSGKHTHDICMATLRRVGIPFGKGHTCLEFGCGVGRVTLDIAKEFDRVVAVDISEPHLALAASLLSKHRIDNVELVHLASIEAIKRLPVVDLIQSVITLQHNPPPVIAYMIAALLDRLKPGGVAYFQLPTYKSGYLFEVDRYLAAEADRGMEMHFIPQAQVFEIIRAAGCHLLEVREDHMIGEEDKQLSNSFVVQKGHSV